MRILLLILHKCLLVIVGLLITGTLGVTTSYAASPFKRTLSVKKHNYIKDGTFTGGRAGAGVSVLDVRRVYAAKLGVERVIVEIGDKDGKIGPADQFGYFQASVDSTHNRIILDLAQLRMTDVTEQKLKTVFKKSAFVKSAEFTVDPEDKGATLVLNLKRPARLEAYRMVSNGKPARIILDMAAASSVRVKTN
jgi:hypothetical protein